MGPSETPLRRGSRRRRRRKRGLRIPFLSGRGWTWSDSGGYIDHGYYTHFDD
jgi:hypothetical protein